MRPTAYITGSLGCSINSITYLTCPISWFTNQAIQPSGQKFHFTSSPLQTNIEPSQTIPSLPWTSPHKSLLSLRLSSTSSRPSWTSPQKLFLSPRLSSTSPRPSWTSSKEPFLNPRLSSTSPRPSWTSSGLS